uniref:Uncharacterized protein n=1 Tax=Knipowitschia caucasica TaxID=637954 RepID=A0AAV2M398_KNICA
MGPVRASRGGEEQGGTEEAVQEHRASQTHNPGSRKEALRARGRQGSQQQDQGTGKQQCSTTAVIETNTSHDEAEEGTEGDEGVSRGRARLEEAIGPSEWRDHGGVWDSTAPPCCFGLLFELLVSLPPVHLFIAVAVVSRASREAMQRSGGDSRGERGAQQQQSRERGASVEYARKPTGGRMGDKMRRGQQGGQEERARDRTGYTSVCRSLKGGARASRKARLEYAQLAQGWQPGSHQAGKMAGH